MIFVFTACEDEVADPDVPAGMGSGTPSADFHTPSPSAGESEDESVPGSEDTVVSEASPPADSTPEDSGLPTPPVDETQDPVAERTVTPGDEGVGPQGQAMFPDIRSDVPPLDNYTLSLTGDVDIAEQGEDSQTSINLNYAQSAPDTFHLLYEGDGPFVVEVWNIGEQMWIREDGEVTEATDEIADGFDVGSYLAVLPEIDRISQAEQVGEEEIAGRTATHYVVTGEEAVTALPGMQDAQISDPEGSIDIWLDEEEELILQMAVDLQWTGADDSENHMELEYQITDIGETEEIEPPEE